MQPVVTSVVISGTTYTYTSTHYNWQYEVHGGSSSEATYTTGSGAPVPYTGADLLPLGYDPTQSTQIQFALIPNLYCPMAGYPALYNDIRIHFTNINLTVTGGTPSTPFPITPKFDAMESGSLAPPGTNDVKIGGHIGVSTLVQNSNSRYPASAIVTVTGSAIQPIAFSGTSYLSGSNMPATLMTVAGSVEMQIKAPSSSSNVIQDLIFNIPSTQMPIPKLAQLASSGGVNVVQRFPMDSESKLGVFTDYPVTTYTLLPGSRTSVSRYGNWRNNVDHAEINP